MRGITPRLSGDETRQAVEQHGEDRLIGGAGRQVDLDLGFQFDDAGGEFDQAQPQGVELHDPPHRVRRLRIFGQQDKLKADRSKGA